MVCNNVILSQPEAGAVISHQIPDDISARLNFAAEDIDALQLNDAGALVISFADGGTLNITNFETLIENGNLLFLEDGTLIDQSLLTTAALSPSQLNNIDTAAGAAINGDAIRIGQPAANTTQEIALQGGQKYICDFDPSNAANVEVINGNMVLTFDDGSQVVINDFSEVMAGDLPAELTVADGTAVDSDNLLTGFTETINPTEEVLEVAEAAEVDDIASQVANIQPAAGGDGSDIAAALNQIVPEAGDGGLGGNTGFGFASSFTATPFNSPDDVGPIGPTALQFTAPEVIPEEIIITGAAQLPQDNTPQEAVPQLTNPFELLDETELSNGNLAASGQVNVDFGDDGPGEICSTGNLVISGSEAGNTGTLSSGGVPVIVDFDQATNTYTGTANGTTIFTFVLNEDGSYAFEQFGPLDHADATNDNDQINLDFNFVAKDADGDETAGLVRIIVRDDAPVALSQVPQEVDETNFTAGSATVSGRFFATSGEDVDAEYCGTDSFNATGSVAGGALTSNGVAVVVTFDAATNTYTGAAGALTVFTVVIDSATGAYDFTIFAPLDHADATDPNDQIELNFGAKIVDFDGDSAEGFVTINVLDDAPIIEGGAEAVDETDGFPRAADGTINVEFGEDGAGVLRGNDSFDATGSVDNGVLTSNGVPVVVTFDAATDTYTGVAGTETVFTFTLDPVTGEYAYEQLAPLDHADATDPNDAITLSFGVEAVDFDGDITTTVVTVDVLDDAPLIVRDTISVDETDLSAGPLVVSDQVDVDFGEDGAGEVCGNDAFSARQDLNGPVLNLTSNGVAVVVTFDAATNTYTGVAGTATIFTMVIESDGSYTYTQNAALDHPDGTDANDEITLGFGVKATDFDGDESARSIRVRIADDGPVVVDAQSTVDETNIQDTVTGTVAPQFGADGAGEFNPTGSFDSSGSQLNGALTSDGVPVVVTFDPATGIYTGVAGAETIFTMVVNDDGTYQFDLLGTLDHADPNDPNDIINLDFGVEIEDFDGDTDEGIIRIRVKDDVPSVGDSSGDVDETNLGDGPLVFQDVIETNLGPNQLADVEPNGDTSSSEPLTHCGFPVVISQTATGYEGIANGVVVFTLDIDPATGAYTYTQNEALDHSDTTNPDDVLSINFGINVESNDGTVQDAIITINVADDGPVANDDITSAEEGQFITGDLFVNDELSQDGINTGDNTVTNVRFNGVDFPVPANGSETVTGTYGVLTINSDGTYDYQANSNDPSGVDSFEYTLTDKDGDSSTATLDITVTPDGTPVSVNAVDSVDETNFVNGSVVTTGTLNVDFGPDGAGTVGATDANSFAPGGSLANGALTSNGVPVIVSLNNNTYTGTANGVVVFTNTINPDGTYTFELFEQLDHGDDTAPNDAITLDFGISAADADGDVAEGIFTVTVFDDAPIAIDDGQTNLNEGQTVTGDVTTNDLFSEDADNTVVEVRFGNTVVAVPENGSNQIDGQFGTLTLNSDGTYSYTANGNNPDGVDEFTYVLEDADGDQDTAEISFNVNPIDDQPIITPPATETVDETDGFDTVSGTVVVNFGGDAPGTIDPNDTFESSVPNLTSCGFPVTVALSADGNSYIGTANGQTVFTLEILDNGDYTFTQTGQLDHPDSSNPNDVITLDFGVTATDADGDTATTTISVNVLDDGPQAVNDGQTTLSEGQTTTGNVVTNDDLGQDTVPSGNVVTNVSVNGSSVPVSAAGNTQIAGTFGTLTIDAEGNYSYEANNNNATQGADTFTYTITDKDGDTDTATVSFNVEQDDQPIIAPPPVETVDETDGFDMVTGTINVNFGDDAPGSIDPNGVFTSSVANLTHCDEPVTVRVEGNTYIGESTSGEVVFTLEVLDNGEYKFTQLAQLDHPDTTNPNDVINLNFGITATDADGDESTTTLTVRVLDDGPEIGSITNAIDETSFGNTISADGVVPHDFGQDGAGEITPNGLFQALFQMDGSPVTLSSGGNPINVTDTGNGYVGTANGQTIFTLTIDPATGEYSYTQFDSIDHPDDTDPNDVIWLKFYVDITDKDGDTDTGTIIIDVADDAPTIADASSIVDETGGLDTVTGTVASDAGADGSVQGVVGNNVFSANDPTLTSNGQTVNVTYNANTGTYTGTAGGRTIFTLNIAEDGEYTFTQLDELDHPNTGSANETIRLRFGVEITDGDDDTDSGTIIIDVRDDGPTIGNASSTVDETGGLDTVTGTVASDAGQDGSVQGVVGNNVFTSSDTTLTSNGQPVTVRYNVSNGTYVGSAGGLTTFILDIESNGEYSFTQFQTLDHPDTNSANDNIALRFGVEITDGDGDSDTGVITINVRDDGPNAVNDSDAVGRTQTRETGNVLTNDTFGQDGAGRLLTTGTFVGNFGTLTLNGDGSYTYVRNGAAGGTDTFDYTIEDNDGDRDTAQLTINVTANPAPPPPPPPTGGRGDGGGNTDDGRGDGDGTPLVFDLDGDGIELTTTENGVMFDVDVDGVAEQTAWVGADDGLLALDRNGDGQITDRSELFGDTDGFEDGFQNLASYDTNADNVIDANDDIFGDLRIWQDIDQDGVSDEGELLTLAQIGIVSINLNASLPEDFYIEGNLISHISDFTFADGSTGTVVDAIFNYDNATYATDGVLDTFLFQAVANEAAEATADVVGFNAEEGDALDLSLLIDSESDVTEAIQDFVFVTETEDGDTIISVDADGANGPAEAQEVVTLRDVTGQSLADLVDNGNIIV